MSQHLVRRVAAHSYQNQTGWFPYWYLTKAKWSLLPYVMYPIFAHFNILKVRCASQSRVSYNNCQPEGQTWPCYHGWDMGVSDYSWWHDCKTATQSFNQQAISGIFEKDCITPARSLETIHWHFIVRSGKCPEVTVEYFFALLAKWTKLVEKHGHQWDQVEKWLKRVRLWMWRTRNTLTDLFHLYHAFYISAKMLYDRNLCPSKSKKRFK